MFRTPQHAHNALLKDRVVFVAFLMTVNYRKMDPVPYEAIVRLDPVGRGTFGMGDVVFDAKVKDIVPTPGDRLLVHFVNQKSRYTNQGKPVLFADPADDNAVVFAHHTPEFRDAAISAFGPNVLQVLAGQLRFADGNEITQDPFTPRGIIWNGKGIELVADAFRHGFEWRDQTWIHPDGVHGSLTPIAHEKVA